VKEEHNMWSYMYYLIYLNETEPNDYTALDLCVAKQVPPLWTYLLICVGLYATIWPVQYNLLPNY